MGSRKDVKVDTIRKGITRHSLSAYFLLAFGISWLSWLPAILDYYQGGGHSRDSTTYLIIGSYGPALAALTVSASSCGVTGVKRLLKRLLPEGAGIRWYLAALYGPLLIGLPMILVLGIAGPSPVLSKLPIALVYVPLFGLTAFLIQGPLGEELGWRGYALPQLQRGHGPLVASVILGVIWALWHFPLMLLPGWRGELPIGLFLVLYILYIVPLSIIFAWVYNHSNESVLVTTILHAAFNYTLFVLKQTFGFAQDDPLRVQVILDSLLWSVAIGLFLMSGRD